MTNVRCDRTVSFERPGDIVVTAAEVNRWLNVVKRADPIVRFSDEVLTSVAIGDPFWPAHILRVTLDDSHVCSCRYRRVNVTHYPCFMGAKVECVCENATFVYIIKRYDWEANMWIGAWPD